MDLPRRLKGGKGGSGDNGRKKDVERSPARARKGSDAPAE
jgi:hypothetical protein